MLTKIDQRWMIIIAYYVYFSNKLDIKIVHCCTCNEYATHKHTFGYTVQLKLQCESPKNNSQEQIVQFWWWFSAELVRKSAWAQCNVIMKIDVVCRVKGWVQKPWRAREKKVLGILEIKSSSIELHSSSVHAFIPIFDCTSQNVSCFIYI